MSDLIPIKRDAGDRVQTVFVSVWPKERSNFRCGNCGWVVAQIKNEIGLIIEGDVLPKGCGSVDVRCRRCNLLVRFIV